MSSGLGEFNIRNSGSTCYSKQLLSELIQVGPRRKMSGWRRMGVSIVKGDEGTEEVEENWFRLEFCK